MFLDMESIWIYIASLSYDVFKESFPSRLSIYLSIYLSILWTKLLIRKPC